MRTAITSNMSLPHQVIVTERAGHAYDTMATIGNKELISYDGVIAVVSNLWSFCLFSSLLRIYPSYSKLVIVDNWFASRVVMVFSTKFLMDFFLHGIKLHIHQLLQISLILLVVMRVSLWMIQIQVTPLLKLLLRTMSNLLSSQVQVIMAQESQISVSMIIRFFHTSQTLLLISCLRWHITGCIWK